MFSGLVAAVAIWVGCAALPAAEARHALPLDDRLVYEISYLGVGCGEMTIESAQVEGKPSLVRMLMTVRTSEFFDSVYKVRAEIESIYHTRRGSTRSYHERSSEKDKPKDDLWMINPRTSKAHRTLNGTSHVFDLPAGGGHDPLAMLYRLRALATEPGEELSVTVITTKGSIEALALVERWERFETASGEVTGLKVTQSAVDDQQLARGGGMTMWLAADDDRTPYRIEFDMPFGKLVAELVQADEEAGS
jgi:hypothetical protein